MAIVSVNTPTGISFQFKSNASSFISNVLIALERLDRDYGYKTEPMKMGEEFTIGVY